MSHLNPIYSFFLSRQIIDIFIANLKYFFFQPFLLSPSYSLNKLGPDASVKMILYGNPFSFQFYLEELHFWLNAYYGES